MSALENKLAAGRFAPPYSGCAAIAVPRTSTHQSHTIAEQRLISNSQLLTHGLDRATCALTLAKSGESARGASWDHRQLLQCFCTSLYFKTTIGIVMFMFNITMHNNICIFCNRNAPGEIPNSRSRRRHESDFKESHHMKANRETMVRWKRKF